MEDERLEKLLAYDFSSGTEPFREALLGRCLEILQAMDDADELDEDELELLAAAGDAQSMLAFERSRPKRP